MPKRKAVSNPKVYDDKVPTNLRLDADLKKLAKMEAKQSKTTMSDIVNEALEKRYK